MRHHLSLSIGGVFIQLAVATLVVVLPLPLSALIFVLPDGLGRHFNANHDAPLQRDGDLLLEVLVRAASDGHGHPEVPLRLQLGDLLARQVAVLMLAEALALGRQAVGLATASLLGALVLSF